MKHSEDTEGQVSRGLGEAAPSPMELCKAGFQEILGYVASVFFFKTPVSHWISSVYFITQAPVGPRRALQRGQSPLGDREGVGQDSPAGQLGTCIPPGPCQS